MRKITRAIITLWAYALLTLSAFGYEYHLQNTLSTGRTGTAIGESFNADGTVSGSLNYFHQSCVSRTCGPKTYYCGTATWDAQGNLLNDSLTGNPATDPTNGSTACPVTETVLYVTSAATPAGTPPNTEQVYAVSGLSRTGRDTRGFGYVDVPASHYTWQTVNGGYIVQSDAPFTFDVVVANDGDLPLNITSTVTQVIVSGYYTNGTGTVTSVTGDCLSGPTSPGSICTLSAAFDPTTIHCTGSPYGYGYNVLTLALASDAGNLPDWDTHFTITGVPMCND